jgi:hypothetical protein
MERLILKPGSEIDSFCEKRQSLESKFEYFYQDLGYRIAPPVAIYPSSDRTTMFVGSTISALRNELGNETSLNRGVCIVQPCLRTQTKKYLYDDGQLSEYNSFFHQAGVLISAGNYERVCEESVLFLTREMNIDPGSLQIQVPSQFPEVGEFWSKKYPHNTVVDAHSEQYYQWTYGEKGITGLGVTFSVRSREISEFRDIGNVIAIYNDGKEIAIEWGFGIETLLSRIHGLSKPQATSRICDFVQFVPGMQEKLLDTLVTSIEMIKSGVTPDRSGGAKQILKTYLKAIHYLSRRAGIDYETIRELANKYLFDYRIGGDIPDKILLFLQERDDLFKLYQRDVPKVEGSSKARGVDVEQELAKLRQRLGLEETESL